MFLDLFKRGVNDELLERVNNHRKVMPAVMDFVEACDLAVSEDGKLSREDSQTLMKHYWVVVKSFKNR